MKIKDIYLENFRGFNHLHLPLNGESAVIVGANGAGKSSVLNATVTLLSRIIDPISFGVSKKVQLNETDIKNGKHRYKIKAFFEYNGLEGSTEIIKSRSKTAQSKSFAFSKDDFKKIVEHIHGSIDENVPTNIPVSIFYSAHRNVIDVPLRIKNKHEFDQFSTYLNCFSSGTDFRSFFEWFRNQEDLENEEKLDSDINYRDRQLEAVRKAVYGFMPGFSDLRIMRKGKMRMVISKNGHRLELNQLSDGEKSTLAMIGDLARRLALANPLLEKPLRGQGIVFIDEIELHLHPAWQRKIIQRLENVFPNIQFIISTHSPQVLGEIQSAKVYLISELMNENSFSAVQVDNTFGKDSNLILEEYMGASSKNELIKNQIEYLYKNISINDLEKAKDLLAELSNIIGNTDPNLIKAEMIIKRKENLKK
ncbi:AAA family ATPase [Bacillus cereus group sp. TH228LC]|uniref:AAA family ATPase n=1 Tax=Bacillus cereus group sp. TH228LC TaxID=3018049 RepID=UPI0022E618D0|nr:AAA family ATPase [Bacillus cereus group sp. TH228LC]MDA1580530.1 AAA family ATPase [Bacillus cereus group sp. TH228LC]